MKNSTPISVEKIAGELNGIVIGDKSALIYTPAAIENAVVGSITFLSNPKYEAFLYTTEATAVLVEEDFKPINDLKCILIKVKDVYHALTKLLGMFMPYVPSFLGVSNNCSVSSSVYIGDGVGVGDFTVIRDNASIGPGTQIAEQVFIGAFVKIGKNCSIQAGVKIYPFTEIGDNCVIHSNAVIGSDGFGFARDEDGQFAKMPQIGRVVIKDNVEIGACTTIDRATIGETVIEEGTKLDNLIQIAHNVRIGKNTAIAAQTGISGSTDIGNNCMIGGQAGIVGHISIANNTLIQAKSGVASNITEEGQKLYGYPAIEYQKYLRAFAYFKKLPEIVSKIREIDTEVDMLKNKNT